MSKRKTCNRKAQIERSLHALMGTAVISIDPSGLKIMINWKSGKQITSGHVAGALCDISYRRTMHVAGICVQSNGAHYIKMTALTPDGIHRVEKLSDVVEHFYDEVEAECTANHLVGMAWLAVPGTVEASERHVSDLPSSIGAWNQVKVAA